MKKKIVRITTVPESLKALLKGQLKYIQNEFEVIAVSSSGKELQDVEIREGVRVFCVEMRRHISPFRDMLSIYRLFKFFKREAPYIVHSHTPKAGFVAMTAAYMAGVPNRLHTVAGLPLMETEGVKRFILLNVEKFTYYLSTLVLPNSFGLKEFIINNRLANDSKTMVLGNGSSNGIDLTFFQLSDNKERIKELIEKHDLTGKFVFLFIGRLVSHKGINELIKAFENVNARYTDTVLLLVGEFEDKLDPLSDYTKRKMLNESVRHVGFQHDVREFLEIADVFVFPSYREGFPNSVLQACAYNLPCIVTDINGCNEIISDNENGILISPKNEKALENAMNYLYVNVEARIKLGSGNREKIEKQFSQRKVWENISLLYNSL